MRLLAILAAGVVLAVIVDRLLLAAEARGWIYYRKKQSSPGTSASAFLELHSMLEPGRKYEIQANQSEEEERDDEGEPPSPGNRNEERRMRNEE
ncbi:MAG: hypothetical protein WC538_14040 [Thermoanaerobaculia bacterium]|jgi:hypothetical protein